jgi:hypothetical protein
MGKLCSLSSQTTFMLGGMASMECKRVKNASQCLPLLFMGAENSVNFSCNSCQIYWSKYPRAFGKVVVGSLVSNFSIQRFVHFCRKNWRKFNLKWSTWNWFEPERQHPHDVAPRTPRRPAAIPPRAHAETPEDPSVWGQMPWALCAYGAWQGTHP